MPRLHAAATTALAAALLAGFLPCTATGQRDRPSLRELARDLSREIANEKRIFTLLARERPGVRAARVGLRGSDRRLTQIGRSLNGIPGAEAAAAKVFRAAAIDGGVAQFDLRRDPPDVGEARFDIVRALHEKETALPLLRQPENATGPQCSDKVDNDGNGDVDSRHDGGCTNGRDRTERSPLRCSPVGFYRPIQSGFLLEGGCTGPFARFRLQLPAGATFNVNAAPGVQFARVCHYFSLRRLECLMLDGRANRAHQIKAQIPFGVGLETPTLQVSFYGFGGRRFRPITVPPAEFNLGANPVNVIATFSGPGGCGLANQFTTNRLQFLAPGNKLLVIRQPGTPDVTGQINPDGSFSASNASESYTNGKLTPGTVTGTADYTFTTSTGCKQPWKVSIAPQQ